MAPEKTKLKAYFDADRNRLFVRGVSGGVADVLLRVPAYTCSSGEASFWVDSEKEALELVQRLNSRLDSNFIINYSGKTGSNKQLFLWEL